ncbi:MAG: hypothetical protein IPQ09_10985 [Myxococcales bacterium]|nr:hypothetical protein [Myxococcales bacterium]HQY60874.1 hypothetical protein [Polyangiaceae bacterium]
MKSLGVVGTLGVGFLGLAMAVGVGGLGGAGCSGAPAYDDFASTLASTYCDALEGCCEAAKFEYDEQSCVPQVTAEVQRTADVVKRGKVIYDKTAADACVEAYKARALLCVEDAGATPASGFEPYVEACAKVFKGTVSPGGECTESAECQADFPREIGACSTDNRPSADRTKKVCYKQVRVGPGEVCATSQTAPSPDQFEIKSCDPATGYCDGAGGADTTRKCRAYAKAGEDCFTPPSTIVQCDVRGGLSCDPTSRKCIALPPVGQPCTAGQQCAKGAYCLRATTPGGASTCTAQKGDGSDCDSSAECLSSSCESPPTTGGDGGRPKGKCGVATDNTANPFEVSPRSCGFGPAARGPVDGGVQPIQTQSILRPLR